MSSSPRIRKLLAGAAMAAVLFAPGALLARPNMVVSAPFEVGSSPSGNYLAALVAIADTDTLAAATFFREALRYDSRNRELLARAYLATLTNGNMAEAFVLAKRVLQFDPKNALGHIALSVRAIKARQWQAARAEIDRSPKDLMTPLLKAWTFAGAGQTAKALQTLDEIKDPRLVPFRDYHAGLIADLANNATEADKRLQSAYDGLRTSLRVADAYGRFLSRRGDRNAARAVYEEFAKAAPRHPMVLAALKDLDAGKTLEPIVNNAISGAGEVFYVLGADGGQQNDSFLGMIYLRFANHLAPENGLAIATLAEIYERQKQYERAIDVYNMMPPRSPLRGEAEIQTALTLEAMKRSDDAMTQMKAIVAERPSDLEAVSSLANLHQARKQWVEAAANYSKAIDLVGAPTPADWRLFYSRGIAYERSKEWPKAEADFHKALELRPDQPQVLNYLGYSWVDKGINLDEAFRMLRKAVDQASNDGYIVDSLGWAYFKLGRFDDARRELETAVDLKPGDPTINDHLGDIYYKVGRKLEATFQWNHARDLNPEPEDLPRILKKIETGALDDEAKAAAPADAIPAAVEPAKGGG